MQQIHTLKISQREFAFLTIEIAEHSSQRLLVSEPPGKHVGEYRKPIHQIELLPHKTNSPPQTYKLTRIRLCDDASVDADFTSSRTFEAVDATQQRRFSRTRSTDHTDNFTGFRIEADLFDRLVPIRVHQLKIADF